MWPFDRFASKPGYETEAREIGLAAIRDGGVDVVNPAKLIGSFKRLHDEFGAYVTVWVEFNVVGSGPVSKPFRTPGELREWLREHGIDLRQATRQGYAFSIWVRIPSNDW